MSIMDLIGLQPTDPLFYVTIGLFAILVILISILIVKKVIVKGVKNRLKRALFKKGIRIEEPKQEISKKLFSKGKMSTEQEVDDLVRRLNEIVEKEKVLKSKERAITKEIERLYKQTVKLQGDEPMLVVKKVNNEGINEDIKKVLLIVDDLLENLPDDKLEEFTSSDEFELYKKVLKQVKDGSS